MATPPVPPSPLVAKLVTTATKVPPHPTKNGPFKIGMMAIAGYLALASILAILPLGLFLVFVLALISILPAFVLARYSIGEIAKWCCQFDASWMPRSPEMRVVTRNLACITALFALVVAASTAPVWGRVHWALSLAALSTPAVLIAWFLWCLAALFRSGGPPIGMAQWLPAFLHRDWLDRFDSLSFSLLIGLLLGGWFIDGAFYGQDLLEGDAPRETELVIAAGVVTIAAAWNLFAGLRFFGLSSVEDRQGRIRLPIGGPRTCRWAGFEIRSVMGVSRTTKPPLIPFLSETTYLVWNLNDGRSIRTHEAALGAYHTAEGVSFVDWINSGSGPLRPTDARIQ